MAEISLLKTIRTHEDSGVGPEISIEGGRGREGVKNHFLANPPSHTYYTRSQREKKGLVAVCDLVFARILVSD